MLAATAAGRRTDGAYPQFVARYGYDATIYATRPMPRVDKLASVSSVIEWVTPSNGQPRCDCAHQINITSSNFSVLVEPAGAQPLWKLVSGRLPSPTAPYQVLASFSLQRDDGVQVGTVIRVPFFAPSQALAANSITGAPPKPLGPTAALHVVGIVASEFDFPSGDTPSYELLTTPAFDRTVIPRTATGVEYAVRLRHGAADLARFNTEVNNLNDADVEGVANNNGLAASVEASIHPQAVGWWVLAALAALVGLAVVGQALTRQSRIESEAYPTLVALGADRRQLFLLGMARNLALSPHRHRRLGIARHRTVPTCTSGGSEARGAVEWRLLRSARVRAGSAGPPAGGDGPGHLAGGEGRPYFTGGGPGRAGATFGPGGSPVGDGCSSQCSHRRPQRPPTTSRPRERATRVCPHGHDLGGHGALRHRCLRCQPLASFGHAVAVR